MERKGFIGGSDVPVILGLVPEAWGTPQTLWEEKTGRREPEFEVNDDMMRGILNEPVAAKLFGRDTGLVVLTGIGDTNDGRYYHRDREDGSRDFVVIHKTIPYLHAQIDRFVCVDIAVNVPIEIKCPRSFKVLDIENGILPIPSYYLAQIFHQMFVTDAPYAYLMIYSAENTHRIIEIIPRHDLFIERMLARLQAFWKCIETDTPPPEKLEPIEPPAHTTEASRAIIRLDDSNLNHFKAMWRWAAVKAVKKEATAADKAFTDTMKLRANHQPCRITDGINKITVSEKKGRESADYKRLKADFPKAYEACVKVGKSSISVRPTFGNNEKKILELEDMKNGKE